MDIILLENYPHDGIESMSRYAGMLKNLLVQGGHHVESLRPEPFFGRLKRSGQGLGKWLGYLDKFILFPLALRCHIRRRKEPFLVHICDHSNAMYTRWLQDVPHLVSCHDVFAIQSALGLIPRQRTGWAGRILQRWILSGLKRARRIVCVSEETRGDLLSLAPELRNRCTVIENALNYPYAPMRPEEARGHLASLGLADTIRPGDRFLFHVGGNQWYKNREGVIRIFGCLCSHNPDMTASPPLRLVMAGPLPTKAMRRMVDAENLAGKVIFAGVVSNEQLRALYSEASALVFPSLREGFGWPILEAQACGCPVVTSDRPPMNRLAGPAALVAQPGQPADFAGKIQELLSEGPATREQRKSEGQRHADRFDSQTFLKKIVHEYEIILKNLVQE